MTDARRRAAAYPALRAFCRAYLHEDALTEYGSAPAAARAFRADASPGERRAVAVEWRRFIADGDGPAASVAARLRAVLGATTVPATEAEVVALGRALAPVNRR